MASYAQIQPRRRKWNPSPVLCGPDNWDPEDATVEVWSENGEETTWMIEASLRENNIYSRTDVLADGSRKVFVAPNDESRAREIVHEIKDATPPQ
jgi:hypothetical protein